MYAKESPFVMYGRITLGTRRLWKFRPISRNIFSCLKLLITIASKMRLLTSFVSLALSEKCMYKTLDYCKNKNEQEHKILITCLSQANFWFDLN